MHQVKPMKLLHSPVLQVRKQQNVSSFTWLYLINCLKSQTVFASLATPNKCTFPFPFPAPPFPSRDNHFSSVWLSLLVCTEYNCLTMILLDFFLIFTECLLCSRLLQTLEFQQRSNIHSQSFCIGGRFGLITK